mgnify:CR=1 FL=1
MIWLNLLLPKKQIKHQDEKFDRIYLPEDTAGAGLFFMLPKKLIRPIRGRKTLISIGYNDKFIFPLYEEKDGRSIRLKRSPLTADDVGNIFADLHRKSIEKAAIRY